MGPVIQMPDTELWATGWIRGALAGRPEEYAAGVYVDHRTPDPLKPRMAIVRGDGGTRVDFLHEQTLLAVNVYAQSEQLADSLARLLEGLLLSVRAEDPVAYITSQSRPVRIDDAAPRRYFVVEVTMRGADVSYPSGS